MILMRYYVLIMKTQSPAGDDDNDYEIRFVDEIMHSGFTVIYLFFFINTFYTLHYLIGGEHRSANPFKLRYRLLIYL